MTQGVEYEKRKLRNANDRVQGLVLSFENFKDGSVNWRQCFHNIDCDLPPSSSADDGLFYEDLHGIVIFLLLTSLGRDVVVNA